MKLHIVATYVYNYILYNTLAKWVATSAGKDLAQSHRISLFIHTDIVRYGWYSVYHRKCCDKS